MAIQGADRAIENLAKWCERDDWAPLQAQVFAEHIGPVEEMLDLDEEEIIDLLGEEFGPLFIFILEDFYTVRFDENGELNVVDDYLKRRGWREKGPARLYLQALRDSSVSLYEVVGMDPGRTVTVRDLILGGDPVKVWDKLGSQTAARWDRIAGRIVTVVGKRYFTSSLLHFPHDVANFFLQILEEATKHVKAEFRKEARKQREKREFTDQLVRELLLSTSLGCQLLTRAWMVSTLGRALAPPPELYNSDRDEILISAVHFPIKEAESEVAAALDEIDSFERDCADAPRWTWQGLGSPSQRMSESWQESGDFESGSEIGRTSLGTAEIANGELVLNTNSRARAERGRDLLAPHLGEMVGSPLISHQDVQQARKEMTEPIPEEPEFPPRIAEQAIHAYLERHYRRSLDDPIPMLNGKTPRQAVATKKGRALVIDWLKQVENSEHRRAAAQGQKPYDTAWMWDELKIQEPG